MIKAGGGAIVTLGGMMALWGAKNRVHGSVVKHGLAGIRGRWRWISRNTAYARTAYRRAR